MTVLGGGKAGQASQGYVFMRLRCIYSNFRSQIQHSHTHSQSLETLSTSFEMDHHDKRSFLDRQEQASTRGSTFDTIEIMP